MEEPPGSQDVVVADRQVDASGEIEIGAYYYESWPYGKKMVQLQRFTVSRHLN